MAKLFIAAIIVGTIGYVLYRNNILAKIAPPAKTIDSNIPPVANLPGENSTSSNNNAIVSSSSADIPKIATVAAEPAGCGNLPEVRFYHWAWNAQMGLMYATGGKQATKDSLMCQHGVNLKLIREDDSTHMQELLGVFADRLKKGEQNPTQGAHFVAIMGDGAPTFFKGINDTLKKLGPDYITQVIGVGGYSRGEDKFMGPAAWKTNPQAARGGIVAGYLRDGDWNIAMKWLADNKIPNNPDEKVYDPDALNWVAATDYIDAAQKYVSGFCSDMKNKKTGETRKYCVNAVVTWTPGDVTVADNRGGLTNIVSTREYRNQMPCVIIGNKKWMSENRKTVEGMLAAILEGGDAVKQSDDNLKRAAAISALAYGEKEPGYWYKYFHVVAQNDKTGQPVELGGSSVNNLADDLQTFGLAPGSTNLFAATYTIFGDIQHSQYPKLVPNYPPWQEVTDLSYLKNVAAQSGGRMGVADVQTFQKDATVKSLVSRRAWDIQFESGSAKFTPQTARELEELERQLEIAGGTLVEIHGHTDNVGSSDHNQQLSEDRAFAVKQFLEQKSPSNFPEGRVKIFAHGMTQPVAPNSSPDGRAKNRRVEVVLGTST